MDCITTCKRGNNLNFPSENDNHLGNVLAVIADAWYIDTCIEEIGIRYAAHITQATDYSAFGAPLPGRTWYSGKQYRQSFNGKEKDDETSTQDYGMRIYNQRLARFLSIDPLIRKYPTLTPYQFASNCPISGTDLDGLEYFYAADGAFIGKLGTSQEVRLVKDKDVNSIKDKISAYNAESDKLKNIDDPFSKIIAIGALAAASNAIIQNSTSLGIDHEQLLAFASLIHAESGGNKQESYGIGNVTANYITDGGSKNGLKTLEDVTMYENDFAYGATQGNFSYFKSLSPKDQNSKSAMGAAINAVGRMNNLNSKGFNFSDNTNGANAWDGAELVRTWKNGTKVSNSHKNYRWSTKSKEMLKQFQKKVGDGTVNVGEWKHYSETNFNAEAKAIIGRTLYEKVHGARTEGKINKAKFR